MVLIADISEKEGRAKQEAAAGGDGAKEEAEQAPAKEFLAEKSSDAAPSDEKHLAEPSAAGGTVYNECAALRVAYVVRNYLYLRQVGLAREAGVTPVQAKVTAPGGRCRAMMEVVCKAHGKWVVSKLIAEHSHSLSPASEAGSSGAMPAVGMEFDSVTAAKSFYYGYGEKLGFKARTGSNRRSASSGSVIMQRFLCWKRSYLMDKKNKEASAIKRKRGPYMTRARKHAEAVARAAKKGAREDVDEVDDECSDGVQKNPSGKKRSQEKDARKKGAARVAGLDVATNHGNDGGNGNTEQGSTPLENSVQSSILKELGVRVSHYTNEERRKILNKYLMKRSNRPVVGRPPKIASRQALAERRQRGIGGRFLGREGSKVSLRQSSLAERRQKRTLRRLARREEKQATNKEDEGAEPEPDPLTEVVVNLGGEPKVGMIFLNEDKAYEFYVNYAATVGFSVRKGCWDKFGRNGTRSRVYVCSREGFRPKIIKNDVKRPRPETRTGCQAHMTIKITVSGRYVVTEFVAEHNHELEVPMMDIQVVRSQKLMVKVQPESLQPNAVLIPAKYKNYLRARRTKDMQAGDVGAICEYLQKLKGDNPSCFYAIQVDEDDQLTNIFWANAKSMMDYHYFGDVVCFDMSYRTNDYGRPLALFIGVNHHKQPIIFGAAFVYDESLESFKWLFETFKSAMGGKQPGAVFSGQCPALDDAVAAVWPGTTHRLSILHAYENANTILKDVFEASETFAHDFSWCLYDCEEEEEFLSAWQVLLEKYDLKNNDWLHKLFQDKERWAVVYGRETFCADIMGTLRSNNITTVLKAYLKPDIDLPSFFKMYDKFINERRFAEQQADYLANQGMTRIPPLRLLWQAANTYTPALFEVFRLEVESLLNCMVYSCGEVGTVCDYEVIIKDKARGYRVRFDSLDCTVVCSCRKFEFVGVQCSHALKILEHRNIRELPPHYILKRWRKDAKNESSRENHDFAFDDNPKSSLSKRYGSLCRLLYKIAARASENAEAYAFMESQSDQLLEQVERILQARLLEKTPSHTSSKGHQLVMVQNEGNNNESRRVSGKKNKNGDGRRKNQNSSEPNKRRKGRQGISDEMEVVLRSGEPPAALEIPTHPRTPPNQFLNPSQLLQEQAPLVSGQQFGLGSVQGFHNLAQFNQGPPSQLQQQPFHSSTQMTQDFMQAIPPPDMLALQFLGSNPQLGHQRSDQGQYTMPLWDFL